MWLYNCLFVVCCHKTVLYIIYKIVSHRTQTEVWLIRFLPRISIHLVQIFRNFCPKNIFSKIFGFLVFSRIFFHVGCVCRRIYMNGKPLGSTIEGTSALGGCTNVVSPIFLFNCIWLVYLLIGPSNGACSLLRNQSNCKNLLHHNCMSSHFELF